MYRINYIVSVLTLVLIAVWGEVSSGSKVACVITIIALRWAYDFLDMYVKRK